jgi:hypothetical protein
LESSNRISVPGAAVKYGGASSLESRCESAIVKGFVRRDDRIGRESTRQTGCENELLPRQKTAVWDRYS